MKRIALSALAFVAVHLFVAYILWVGGWDFDSRSPVIAYFAVVGLAAGIFAASVVYDRLGKDK